MLGAALLTVSCSDIDEQVPQSGSLTTEQVQETNVAVPSRLQATFDGMFNFMAKPKGAYPTSSRADDFGFVMAAAPSHLLTLSPSHFWHCGPILAGPTN